MHKHGIILGQIRILVVPPGLPRGSDQIGRPIIIRIVRHQSTVVQIRRQHKRQRFRPAHHRQRFRFGALVLRRPAVLIGKVPIQIHIVRIRPANDAALVALVRHLIAVRIHRRQQMDARRAHQLRDALVACVVLAQVLGEQQQQLAADHLVAVHIGHVLELGDAGRPPAGRRADLQHPEVALLHRLADRVEARDRRIGGGQLAQFAGQLLVVVVRVVGGQKEAVLGRRRAGAFLDVRAIGVLLGGCESSTDEFR